MHKKILNGVLVLQIVAVMVKPLLEHFESMATAFVSPKVIPKAESRSEESRELPPAALVYLLNSLHSLHGALARLTFTGEQIAVVAGRLEVVLTNLTRAQAAHILNRAGLRRLYEALTTPQGENTAPLPQRGFTQDEIIDALVSENSFHLHQMSHITT